jgi:hypothetical protein
LLVHRFGNGTHFLTPLPPMIGIIGQHARHRREGGRVIRHDCNVNQAGKPWERGIGSRHWAM